MKIAIIEDEKALREVLAEKFKRERFNVVTAANGNDALPLIKKENPDAVIIDLILPGKDGFHILEEMKNDQKLRNIPVYVLSNLGEDENIKRALTLGATDYMVKTQHPIGEVLDKIKRDIISKSK